MIIQEKKAKCEADLPVEERSLTAEDNSTLSEEDTLSEAGRCMNCGCYAVNPSDIAPALVALVYGVENGIIQGARLVFGGVAPIPLRNSEVERYLIGKEITDEVAETASELAVKDAVPFEKNAYKVNELKVLVRRSIVRLQ